ncbi:hypothetical protein BT63DRAFT_220280 [Microthyrium microscopicum]|uniref:Uncharacterized protein n=1 Tax=Microthyrium microscopicum TaxID=703497 RepID=A0A6A6UKY1_9PEZI|nr:hypothetical protein BT63DRAFT_220280 [Microthyrium microscopicum]
MAVPPGWHSYGKNGDEAPSSSHSQASKTSRSTAQSRSTAPTEYSTPPASRDRKMAQHDSMMSNLASDRDRRHTMYEKVSVQSYASTLPSDDEESEIDLDESYEALAMPDSQYVPEAIPSTPRDFADFFPSDNRIAIRHDDSTLDGNMNLRLDTMIQTRYGRKRPLTLFHLRMHDLKSRDFSFRRYCRDSGREVCRSARKFEEPFKDEKPSLQRSLTTALNTLRRTTSIKSSVPPQLDRRDSGYSSVDVDENMPETSGSSSKTRRTQQPTDTIKMEFSNYAHVQVSRRGNRTGKRYTFEYWGVKYAWRRHIKQMDGITETSFHLFREGEKYPCAHVVPDALTISQVDEERRRGGWIPPCSLWIKDRRIIHSHPDVADVIVASALMALVDDCIKTTWPSRRRRAFVIPLLSSPRGFDWESMGPRRFIEDVFKRPQSSWRRNSFAPHNPHRRITA